MNIKSMFGENFFNYLLSWLIVQNIYLSKLGMEQLLKLVKLPNMDKDLA